MFPDAVIETGGPGWLEKEKSHWEGICSRIARHPRELADGFPQADLSIPIRANFLKARSWIVSGLPTIRWADHSGCQAGAQRECLDCVVVNLLLMQRQRVGHPPRLKAWATRPSNREDTSDPIGQLFVLLCWF